MATEQEIAQWYDDWHREHGVKSWRPYAAYKPLVRFLKAEPGQRLLDVGCGTGMFLRAAAAYGLETTGIDVSAEAVRISKQVSPQSDISVQSMDRITFVSAYKPLVRTNLFDYVTAFGSMEHCPEIKQALSEIRRSLRIGGKFIAMVPNSKYDGPQMSIQEEIMETRKSLPEWATMFRDAGFTIQEVGHDRLMWRPDVPLDRTYQFVFTLTRGAA